MNEKREPINIAFTPTNDDMSGYNIDIDVPESMRTLKEAPPLLYDVAAIHFFLRSEENMKTIMEFFDNHVEDFKMGEDTFESEYDADFNMDGATNG